MYEVKFGSEASKNDAYKDNRLQHADWTILDESLAVLTPLAHATKHLEGTQYVTISLVLPYIYRLIDSTADGALRLPWKRGAQEWLRASEIDVRVRAARKALHEDLKLRWIIDLPAAQREELKVATLLNPRFKSFDFPGLTASSKTSLEIEREHAITLFRDTWTADWKPARKDTTTPQPAQPPPQPVPVQSLSSWAATNNGASLSSFFSVPLAPGQGTAEADAVHEEAVDELEAYLALPVEKKPGPGCTCLVEDA